MAEATKLPSEGGESTTEVLEKYGGPVAMAAGAVCGGGPYRSALY